MLLYLAFSFAFLLVPARSQKGSFRAGIREEETELTPSDFELGQRIRRGPEPPTDPISKGTNSRFEGDIKLGAGGLGDVIEPELGPLPPGVFRNAIVRKDRRWPGGRIPYTLSTVFSKQARAVIASAIAEYHKSTCVRFVPKADDDTDYVYIMKDEGCYSEVGRGRGRQVISLDNGCVYKGIIMHELMHTSGFFHEQSRTDRDDYIDIVWKNISPGADGQFQKYSKRTIDGLGEPYDYGSIMHYSSTAFTKNGRATIVPKEKGAEIGQRRAFSAVDKKKINKLYKCDQAKGKGGGGGKRRPKPKPKARPPPKVVPPPKSGSKPSGRPKRPTITVTGTGVKRMGCTDNRTDCILLKQACDRDAVIQKSCPNTCGFCGSKPRMKCDGDDNDKCGAWARKGYCIRGFLQSFMMRHCCNSCGKV